MTALASQLPAFQDALAAALTARMVGGFSSVGVLSVPLAKEDTPAEAIVLHEASTDQQYLVIKATPGGRRDELGTQVLLLHVSRAVAGEAGGLEVRDRIFAVLAEVVDTLETDPTVGGLVRNARISHADYDLGTDPDVGRWAVVEATIVFNARL
jgi:hypothetical protein